MHARTHSLSLPQSLTNTRSLSFWRGSCENILVYTHSSSLYLTFLKPYLAHPPTHAHTSHKHQTLSLPFLNLSEQQWTCRLIPALRCSPRIFSIVKRGTTPQSRFLEIHLFYLNWAPSSSYFASLTYLVAASLSPLLSSSSSSSSSLSLSSLSTGMILWFN